MLEYVKVVLNNSAMQIHLNYHIYFVLGAIPGNWPLRCSSSPTKLLQMSIINKMRADARYDKWSNHFLYLSKTDVSDVSQIINHMEGR